MMQEDSNQPFYGTTTGSSNRRYEPPQDFSPAGNSSIPEMDYYSATSVSQNQPILTTDVFDPSQRHPNCPPCKPMVHHNIMVDIYPDKRLFMRKAYVGWWFHCACLLLNFMVLMGGLITGEVGIIGFILGLACVLLGPVISFAVYYILYRAIRTASAFFFGLWFCLIIGQLGAQAFFALGLQGYGAAGFLLMVSLFSDSKIVLGVMAAISTFSWIGVFLYSLWVFYQARGEFSALGGTRAATKEFAKKGVQTAYDNRVFMKDVIVENKDTLKQVVVDNKDEIISFAKDHRQEISQFAVENKDVVARVALENQDTIWENRDLVSSVFDSPSK